MMQEQLNFAKNIIEHGGTYPGYKNGSRHKGVRFHQFEIFFKGAFGDEASAANVLNELIRIREVLAVTLEWRETEYDRRTGKRSLGRVDALDAVQDAGNPMLYLTNNVPRPVRARLEQAERRLKFVNAMLKRAQASA